MSVVKLCIDAVGSITTQQTQSITEALANNCRLVWTDLDRSEKDEFLAIAKDLHFHDLAVEDTIKGGQRPKLELFENLTFIVFYSISMENDETHVRELSIFVGPGYIVTVHDGDFPQLESVANRWNSVTKSHRDQPKGLLLYAILDGIVDDYFPIIDEIGDRLEHMESLMFEVAEDDSRKMIFSLRRELSGLRRIVSAERDVVNSLLRHDMPMFTDEVTLYLTDVYDHLLRAYDWLESFRDQLATLLDLQSTAAAMRLNQIMKTLTASSIILMTASLVAGIYGMNFTSMPELDWLLGYPFALGLMLVLTIVIYVQFRKRDWF